MFGEDICLNKLRVKEKVASFKDSPKSAQKPLEKPDAVNNQNG